MSRLDPLVRKKFAEKYRALEYTANTENVRVPSDRRALTYLRAKSARFALLYGRTEGRPKQGISESISG